MTLKGHCLCRDVTFELQGDHNWVGHCHCDSCRRSTGAPLVTFIGHPNGQWQWTGKTPTVYESSLGNAWCFCPRCGSSVAYMSTRFPNEIHFHATLLEDPKNLKPSEIYHADERLPWMPNALPGCANDIF